jgi:hypothetical protein
MGKKLGTDPQIGQQSCYGSGWKPFFLGQWIYSTLLTTMRKIAMHGLREIRMVEGHTRTERGMCDMVIRFPLQGVH